jgi:hypothetical protein
MSLFLTCAIHVLRGCVRIYDIEVSLSLRCCIIISIRHVTVSKLDQEFRMVVHVLSADPLHMEFDSISCNLNDFHIEMQFYHMIEYMEMQIFLILKFK